MTDNEGLRWTQDELLGMLKKKEAKVTALRSAFAKIEANARSMLESFLERKRSEEVRDWSLSGSMDAKKEENVGEDIVSQLTTLIQSSIRNDLLDQVVELSTKVDPHVSQKCEYLRLRCETVESGLRKLLSAGALPSIDPSFASKVFELPLGRTLEELSKSCLIGLLQSLRTVGVELAQKNALLEVQNTMRFPISDSQLRATVVTLGQFYKEAQEELMDAVFQHSFSDQCGEGLTDGMMASYKEQLYSLRILLANIIVVHSPVRVMKEMGHVKKELNALASINKKHETRLHEVVLALVEALRRRCPKCGRLSYLTKGDYRKINDLTVVTPTCDNTTNLYHHGDVVDDDDEKFPMEERRRQLHVQDNVDE
ncbi:hypothetical protein CBR_g26074 [Chara braunii]|uniref:Uncharacterized protein n=1 Tax=Chara braunii TaxID=69332 RepID=A0A388JVU8_CHABU|nr:hypothetical protein CBR_g26074 [Chara braunii]|eukprot:GBG61910.1 hypothetical protein CBR_g26074 [Chara braunii]